MPVSRRDFVHAATAGGLFTIVRPHVLGRRHRAPSDTVRLAQIGIGGQGQSDIRGLAAAGANIVAVCDVDDEAAADSYRRFPQARKYKDYRELIERERDLDAVSITTPDHHHANVTMLALKAGKHVRCQKPLTRTIAEARAVRAAATARPRLVTQMGNQGHAGDGVRLMREWVEAGLIGNVKEVHIWTNRPIWPQGLLRPTEAHNPRPTFDWNLWLGPAPDRPYHPAYAPFRWRGWWDFGTGALGDMACHLMDAAYWILDLGYPTHVEAETSQLFAETAPKATRVTFEYPAKGNRGPITVVWRDGALVAPRPAEWPQNEAWPFGDDGGQLWIGDQGKMTAGVYSENPRLLDAAKMADVTAHPLPVRYPRTQGVYAEFLGGITGGPRPGSDFQNHATGLTEMILLGCLAQRIGSSIDLDSSSGHIITALPDDWITPNYRRGYTLA